MEAGRASGALGVINSVWLDSAFSPLRFSWPAFAYGAVVPWQAKAPDRARFFADYAALTTPAATAADDVAAALDLLSRGETTFEAAVGSEGFYQVVTLGDRAPLPANVPGCGRSIRPRVLRIQLPGAAPADYNAG